MKRIFDKARKLRRELIIWAVIFLFGGVLTLINLGVSYGINGALVPVFEYVVMAVVGIAEICIAIILVRWATALSIKKQKSSLR
jgi:tellurite resistance protein TehA-like permease